MKSIAAGQHLLAVGRERDRCYRAGMTVEALEQLSRAGLPQLRGWIAVEAVSLVTLPPEMPAI